MQYNPSANTSVMENVLLIEESAAPFYSFANSKSYPIVFCNNDTRDELLNVLNSKFSTIKRVCIISHYTEDPVFLNNEGLFQTNNVQFIIDYIHHLSYSINLFFHFSLQTPL